jgi:lipid-A-disaccharide synthase-like uncharacterized protein
MIGTWVSTLLAQARDGAADAADPTWEYLGLGAQVAIAICLAIHVLASKQKGRFEFPPIIGYLGLVATLVLMIYASRRHERVFMIGQFINMLICLRALTLFRRVRERRSASPPPSLPDHHASFPVVAPDSAERKKPNSET